MIDHKHWPVVILQDRYGGVYSGRAGLPKRGNWLALHSGEDAAPETGGIGRVEWILSCSGPFGDDTEAMLFWETAPDWIAVGETPAEALGNLEMKLLTKRIPPRVPDPMPAAIARMRDTLIVDPSRGDRISLSALLDDEALSSVYRACRGTE